MVFVYFSAFSFIFRALIPKVLPPGRQDDTFRQLLIPANRFLLHCPARRQFAVRSQSAERRDPVALVTGTCARHERLCVSLRVNKVYCVQAHKPLLAELIKTFMLSIQKIFYINKHRFIIRVKPSLYFHIMHFKRNRCISPVWLTNVLVIL